MTIAPVNLLLDIHTYGVLKFIYLWVRFFLSANLEDGF